MNVLRQRTFFTGRAVHADGSTDLAWFGADGEVLENGHWEDPSTRTLLMYLNGAWLGQCSLLLVLHGDAEDGKVTLPAVPGLTGYELVWDSADDRPGQTPSPVVDPGVVEVRGASLQVYRAVDET